MGRKAKVSLVDSGAALAGGSVHLTKDEPSSVDYFYGPNTERVKAAVAKYDTARLFAKCNGMVFFEIQCCFYFHIHSDHI